MRIAISLLILAAAAGCSPTPENPLRQAPPLTIDQQKAASDVSTDVNGFTFRLAEAAIDNGAKGNLLLSPISAEIVLSSLLSGAGATDRARLIKDLGLSEIDPAKVSESFYALQHTLVNVPGEPVTISNSMWLKTGITAKQSYLDSLKKHSLADVFLNKPFDNTTLAEVNEWVDKNTKGRIPTIIDAILPQETMFLVNAVTFTGTWKSPFDTKKTRKGEFATADEKKKVDFMTGSFNVHYYSGEGLTAVRLPYTEGAYDMVLVLPPKGTSAPQWLAEAEEQNWKTLTAKLAPRGDIEVMLPRFTFRGDYSLKEPFERMGLGWMFEAIDLSGVSDDMRRQFISRFLQRTMIEVDEEGTKAAAASIGAVALGREAEPLSFRADRPFIYAIVHKGTGTILFLGVCADPTDAGR